MAFPQVQSVTQSTSNATSHNIDMPATVNAGDLLVMFVFCQSAAINGDPAGWTVLRSDAQSPIYIKDAVGTKDGGTVAINTSSSQILVAQVYRITGWVDSGTILNDVEYGTASGTSTAPNPPSLNPTNWGAEDTLWIACLAFNTGGVSAYPSNYTGGIWTNTTPAKVATARRERNIATEDPGTFTITISTTWQAHTVAIRPADAPVLFQGSAEVSFDGTAAMDVVSDIVFTGGETVSFDGVAQTTQVAVFEGSEEVSFDGEAVLSGGSLLLIGSGAVSFDGSAVLNQSAVFEGFADVDLNGLASMGVIREFAASQSVSFDGSANLTAIGWQEVDIASSQIWTVKK